MDVAEFEDLIDRLGEDISLWPEPQRAAATQLLDSSEQAKAVLDAAMVLRSALSAPPIKAPSGLAERIVSAAMRQPQEPASSTPDDADACADSTDRR